jgi:hypothetical protein
MCENHQISGLISNPCELARELLHVDADERLGQREETVRQVRHGRLTRLVLVAFGSMALSLVLLPAKVSAATLTFQPPLDTATGQRDIDDLDHTQMYAWQISNLNAPNSVGFNAANITGARIIITNIADWQTEANRLFAHLLDTIDPKSGVSEIDKQKISGSDYGTVNGSAGLTSKGAFGASTLFEYQDNTNDNAFVDDFAKATNAANCTSGNMNCYTSAGAKFLDNDTKDTALGNGVGQSLPTPGLAISGTTATTSQKAASGNNKDMATGWFDENNTANSSFDTTPSTYTYTFSGSGAVGDTSGEVLALINYILNGGDVALGLDPDCHFFNDNIQFQIDYATGPGSPVPEPATLTLVGSALLVAGFVSRRKYGQKRRQTA